MYLKIYVNYICSKSSLTSSRYVKNIKKENLATKTNKKI